MPHSWNSGMPFSPYQSRPGYRYRAQALGGEIRWLVTPASCWCCFRWSQRRNAPAYAGSASMLRGMLPGNGGSRDYAGGGATPFASSAGAVQIGPPDYDAFERLLGEIQTAYSAEDLGALRSQVTPEMLSYFAEDLARNADRGVVNRISDVKLQQGDLAEAWRERDAEYA